MTHTMDQTETHMEICWHVRAVHDRDKAPGAFHGFVPVFDGVAGQGSFPKSLAKGISRPHRLYIGDEFCVNRLPRVGELETTLGLAREKGLAVTLVTPVLTDAGIRSCTGLFDVLCQWDRAAEVVVNDLGVLCYVKNRYPGFRLAMGRLFNKGVKDPRLDSRLEPGLDPQDRVREVVNSATFDQPNFHALARSLGVTRLEQDLFPHSDPGAPEPAGLDRFGRLDRSVYFPFGYVTTGRACFTAGLTRNPHTPFAYGADCPAPCTRRGMKLSHPRMDLTLFQMGNTIFYMYTPEMLRDLFNPAATRGIRLVYQGGITTGGQR